MAPSPSVFSSTRPAVAMAVALVMALPTVVGWAIIARRNHPTPEQQNDHRPIQVAGDGYISSDACRSCHPSQYTSWRRSYHRTMTQVATPDTVLTNFGDVSARSVDGRPMRLERRGREFWAEIDDPDWNGVGDAPPRITRQVVMTTGSHHQQVYWYATGRGRVLGQLPGIHLVTERRWIPRRAAFMRPPDEPPYSETGNWNSTCIACHTTQGRPLLSDPPRSRPILEQTADTRVAEFGIACEACHGPAERHAAANRSPLRRYGLHLGGGLDPTVTQPVRLTGRLSSQVCGQCHSVWEFYDRDGERRANSLGHAYRPGDELAVSRFVTQPRVNATSPTLASIMEADPAFLRASFWSDGMVRVSGREYNGLIESPCLLNARTEPKTLSCMSCHAMHRPDADPRPIDTWADDQLAPGMDGNLACLQCHDTFRSNLASHTRHRIDSSGSSCYSCHMPYTTYGLLKTLRSHQISSPSVASTIDTGRPNACNLCHLDQTLAWTSSKLREWYGTADAALSPDEQSIAASILWALRGDAGQRAIAADSMGRQSAQQASGGGGWTAPYLALLLDDPYAAVRFIAARSLGTIPQLRTLDYDFVAPRPRRVEAMSAALTSWRGLVAAGGRRIDARLLFDREGLLDADVVNRLLRERDNRRVFLRE